MARHVSGLPCVSPSLHCLNRYDWQYRLLSWRKGHPRHSSLAQTKLSGDCEIDWCPISRATTQSKISDLLEPRHETNHNLASSSWSKPDGISTTIAQLHPRHKKSTEPHLRTGTSSGCGELPGPNRDAKSSSWSSLNNQDTQSAPSSTFSLSPRTKPQG